MDITNENIDKKELINHDHLYNMLTSKELSWQAIIYDLINTEQLDPWNIDLAILAGKYIEKIKELEEANFLISSKILLAASLLLRMKSEILLNEHLRSIDEILFGKKPEQIKGIERIEIDESELPFLYPKTPLPRHRKVSLQELMKALDNAIKTETRRIKKEVIRKQLEHDTDIVLPKMKINIRDRIRKIYSKILTSFKRKKTRLSYSELTGNNREEKIACFLPVLHLDNQHKLFLEQENHYNEIWIWLYHHYKKQTALEITKKDIEETSEELHKETGFDSPLGDFFNSID